MSERLLTVLGRIETDHDEAGQRVASTSIRHLINARPAERAVATVRAAMALGERSVTSSIGNVLADALLQLAPSVAIAVAEQLEPLMPAKSVMLVRVEQWLYNTLLAQEYDPLDFEARIVRAIRLHNNSIVLGRLQLLDAAVTCAREAMELLRELPNEVKNRYKLQVAFALYNLSGHLLALGQYHDALTVAENALATLHELVNAGEASLANLADAYDAYAGALDGLGRNREALEATRHAEALLRQSQPDAPMDSALARLLVNLSGRLLASGQPNDALDCTEESFRHYQALALDSPDQHLADLAGCLDAHGVALADVGGRTNEAFETTRRAVELYRILFAQSRSATLPDLARALENWSLDLVAAGQHQSALAAQGEAISYYRELVREHDAAYRPALARALTNQGLALNRLNRENEAIAAIVEAVEIYGQIRAQNPGMNTAELAWCLDSLSTSYGSTPETLEKAAETAAQAVALYRELVEQEPEAHGHDLARSLDNLAAAEKDLGRLEEALKASAESVNWHENHHTSTAAIPLRQDFANSLNNYGVLLNMLGHPHDARTRFVEAISILEQLDEQGASGHLINLVQSRSNLGALLWDLDEHSEALAQMEEAIMAARLLVKTPAEDHLFALFGAMLECTEMYLHLERHESARELAAEIVELTRMVEEAAPGACSYFLMRGLYFLSMAMFALGQIREAMQAATESVEHARHLVRFDEDYAVDLNDSLEQLEKVRRKAQKRSKKAKKR